MFDQAVRRLTYDLDFRAYPGLTVRVRKPGYGAMLDLVDAEAVLGFGMSGMAVAGPARLEAFAPMVDAFADSLVSWTLADNGIPVPATRAAVYRQDYTWLLDVVQSWYQRVVLRPASADRPDIDPATNEPPVEPVDEAELLEEELTQIPFTIGTPGPAVELVEDEAAESA